MKFLIAIDSSNKELEAHVSKCLEKSLKRSEAVDTESLVIVPGEWVWNISCHVKLIDNDGNAVDACLLAAVAALLEFKRPDVSVNGSKVVIHPVTERFPIPLTFHHIPVPTTFSLSKVDDDTLLPLLDPTLEEENESSAMITLTTNIHRQIVSLSTFGTCKFESSVLSKCIYVALGRSHSLTDSIRNAVLKL